MVSNAPDAAREGSMCDRRVRPWPPRSLHRRIGPEIAHISQSRLSAVLGLSCPPVAAAVKALAMNKARLGYQPSRLSGLDAEGSWAGTRKYRSRLTTRIVRRPVFCAALLGSPFPRHSPLDPIRLHPLPSEQMFATERQTEEIAHTPRRHHPRGNRRRPARSPFPHSTSCKARSMIPNPATASTPPANSLNLGFHGAQAVIQSVLPVHQRVRAPSRATPAISSFESGPRRHHQTRNIRRQRRRPIPRRRHAGQPR